MGIKISVGRVFLGLSAVFLGMALATSATAQTNTVGAIPGHFSVTPTGAATYSIPFDLPPGIGGLTPHLGLAYSSAAGNGLAGYGWSLAGFSAISRCAKNLSADGKVTAVTFTSEDRFCLDGNKLRRKVGTYGANGSTYRTEHETFSRITSYTSGGTGPVPGVGPQWFKAETQGGLTYEYGKTTDSEILNGSNSAVRVWALDRITDKYGNFIQFEYTNDTATHSYRPAKVSYTGHGSLAPTHTVVFTYETPPSGVNIVPAYIAGTMVRETKRLASVTVKYLAGLVHSYTLDYETSGSTHRSRITKITECGPDACLPPTTIAWQNGTAGLGSDRDTGSPTYAAAYAHVMDINGDGRSDLVYPKEGGDWYVMLGNSSGFGAAQSTGVLSSGYQYALVTHYDGNDSADLIIPTGGTWRILRYTGSSFSRYDTAITYIGYDGEYAAVDINGDGLDDLLYKSGYSIYQRLNNGNGFGGPTLVSSDSTVDFKDANGAAIPTRFADIAADFNGDGLRDRMLTRSESCDDLPLGDCGGYPQKFYVTYILGNGTLGNEYNVSGSQMLS
ncbi:MAG TPA: SpvB/TcaC N-terminal domain-containing protein, partial [Gammaproteobacteria bacterium]|nr:SpvB/TcaC N-terminal domain-containing protein [Gammaproteobacteria bacterium]